MHKPCWHFWRYRCRYHHMCWPCHVNKGVKEPVDFYPDV